MDQKDLFGNYKYCELCRRPMPLNYQETLCPHCVQHQLFHDVKEYIRQNDVTEYDVAEHFHIPLYRVKSWIKEGRIEYKENPSSLVSNHCQNCGTSITFGSLCPKCMKAANTSGHSTYKPDEDEGHMRFVEVSPRKKK